MISNGSHSVRYWAEYTDKRRLNSILMFGPMNVDVKSEVNGYENGLMPF